MKYLTVLILLVACASSQGTKSNLRPVNIQDVPGLTDDQLISVYYQLDGKVKDKEIELQGLESHRTYGFADTFGKGLEKAEVRKDLEKLRNFRTAVMIEINKRKLTI